ncbi:MAG: response regulator, partial [Pseudomonadota bacterium]
MSLPAPGVSPANTLSGSSPRRILVVDDEPSVLRIIGRFLRRYGYEVEFDSEPGAALQRAAGGYEPQVILSDYRMPGMDGVAFLHHARDHWP